jgi:hypothetical protein
MENLPIIPSRQQLFTPASRLYVEYVCRTYTSNIYIEYVCRIRMSNTYVEYVCRICICTLMYVEYVYVH